jgi:hypothetical protein
VDLVFQFSFQQSMLAIWNKFPTIPGNAKTCHFRELVLVCNIILLPGRNISAKCNYYMLISSGVVVDNTESSN